MTPVVLSASEQLPVPVVSAAMVQDDPFPVTVTEPVGPARPVPVTLTPTATGWPTTEGLGVCEVMAVTLAIFVAVIDLVAEAAAYTLVAGQFAVSVQVPVPLVMVTVAVALVGEPLTGPPEQTPAGVMVGITAAFVVAVTLKLLL